MARLMVHRNIFKNYPKLPAKVQRRVSELMEEFQENPFAPAIGMYPVAESMLDQKVRGITKLPDGYRAIVIAPEKGDNYLLVHIAPHDDAYTWARNRRFEVHESTGVFQIFNVEELTALAPVSKEPNSVAPDTSYTLDRFNDDELFLAGVPRPLIAAVRSIRSDEALDALGDYLPAGCHDLLYGLAAGMSLDEALSEMLGRDGSPTATPPSGTGDFTHIAEAPNYDLVLVEGRDELKQILASSLDEWRLFLHPCQRQLVNWRTSGAMSITGAAGTGKTVALMHRAVRLARALTDPTSRILVMTFTTNLSITIRRLLRRLDPEAATRIEVTNLHSLARTICSRAGHSGREAWKGRIADDDELGLVWNATLAGLPADSLPLSPAELRLEYELIVEPNGYDDEEQYLTALRSGRPRINRAQRRAAWQVFRAFNRALKKRNLLTFEGAIHEARLAVENGLFTRYAHVLVDETQDFSLEALRLIRALSPSDGSADPLCVVGDGHQRIYRARVPLNRAGIEVCGRSHRLKINYRTSQQIRHFAEGILQGVEIDDLDGTATTTRGDHSAFCGPVVPQLLPCPDERAEAAAILAWIRELLEKHGLATHEICVTPYRPAVRTALLDAGIPAYELRPREEDPGAEEPGVRMGTMKRIKGLEFRAVAMACADKDDPMNGLEKAGLRERCERYVAATRAREFLLVAIAG